MGAPPLERFAMMRFLFVWMLSVLGVARMNAAEADQPTMIVVVGAGGTEQYQSEFQGWASNWLAAAKLGNVRAEAVSLATTDTNSLARLQTLLAQEPKAGPAEFWLVLLGHGTFDGREAKFNLHGDDLSVTNLATMLAPIKRPLLLVNGFATSGAWLKPLSAPNRIVITSTKNGSEVNYSRFGGYLAKAIGDTASDRDKDGQVSLLEAWLTAGRAVADFYEAEGRLATEHPLLDDNGDGLGTPPDWFAGVRAIKKPAQGEADGFRAHQIHLIPNASNASLTATGRAERDRLELAIAKLREAKDKLPEAEYWRQLEELLLKLAQVYGVSPKAD
jgi:hypothetical protein